MSEAKQVSRRKFMALTGGSAAAAAVLAACGSDDDTTASTASNTSKGASETAQFGKGDVGILNYALTLEYLEAAFYADVVESGLFKGSDLATIRKFGAEEAEHVEALTATVKQLGGKPAAEPKFDFPYSGTAGFLGLAQVFEDTGVSAYNGAGPAIKSKEVLGAASSIVQVEARHAAAIRLEAGEEPSPNAFDPSLDEAQVLKAVEPFIA